MDEREWLKESLERIVRLPSLRQGLVQWRQKQLEQAWPQSTNVGEMLTLVWTEKNERKKETLASLVTTGC